MDLNVRAFRTVQAALAEAKPADKRREAARKGGRAGGHARARAISPSRRSEIARIASEARWKTKSAESNERESSHE